MDQMRCALAEVYPGDGWKQKVIKMEDRQVIATYKRMERDGDLYKRNKYCPNKEPSEVVMR